MVGRAALVGGSWGNVFLRQHSNSQLCFLQVPRIVRCIHRWFMTNTEESVEHSLDNTLVELTDAHPHDVVVALLRCAPSCDRYWETCPEGSGLPSL